MGPVRPHEPPKRSSFTSSPGHLHAPFVSPDGFLTPRRNRATGSYSLNLPINPEIVHLGRGAPRI